MLPTSGTRNRQAKRHFEKLRNCWSRYSECADLVNVARCFPSILSPAAILLSSRSGFASGMVNNRECNECSCGGAMLKRNSIPLSDRAHIEQRRIQRRKLTGERLRTTIVSRKLSAGHRYRHAARVKIKSPVTRGRDIPNGTRQSTPRGAYDRFVVRTRSIVASVRVSLQNSGQTAC